MILKSGRIINNDVKTWLPHRSLNNFMSFRDTQEQKDRIYSTVRSKSTSATVNNLKPSTAYVFQIRAFTEAGYGTFGPRLEITTKEEETGRLLQDITCIT